MSQETMTRRVLEETIEAREAIAEEKRRTIMAEGFLMYDPRVKKEVESGNPAIVFAHMVRNTGGVGLMTEEEEEEFWSGVAKLADFCDEEKTIVLEHVTR